MKRVLFWSRSSHEKSQEWKLIEGRDDSSVPLKAWKALNKSFWEWKTDGKLFPMDELDAYQIAAAEIIRAAENPPELTHASLATYLVSAAYLTLLKYKERTVDTTRKAFRIVGELTPDVRAFVESLPGTHAADRACAMRLAADCVNGTIAKLDVDAQAGFRAWLKADGIWVDAARIYDPNGSVQGYAYRFKHIWASAFKEACEWTW